MCLLTNTKEKAVHQLWTHSRYINETEEKIDIYDEILIELLICRFSLSNQYTTCNMAENYISWVQIEEKLEFLASICEECLGTEKTS